MKDIFYFLLGAVVGAMFALLFAPQSGEELRANIQTTAEQDWQKLQAQYQVEMDKIHVRLDQLQSQATGAAQQDEAESDAGEESA